MGVEKYLISLRDSVVDMDFEGVIKAAEEAMEAGVQPLQAVKDGMAVGMKIVGEKFERGEYFLSELVVAGAVMKDGMKIINPHIKGNKVKMLGKVVVATVEGDNHDIGKNIVITLLQARGFEVIDLNYDVPTEIVVKSVIEHEPDILGLSALLTVTMFKMGEVIEELNAKGLRKNVKVIVGGTPVTSEFAKKIGADFRASNAVEGVNKCVEWMSKKKEAWRKDII